MSYNMYNTLLANLYTIVAIVILAFDGCIYYVFSCFAMSVLYGLMAYVEIRYKIKEIRNLE